MAKTASQIQAERKAIDDARNAIHERQMAEIADKKTQSTDPAKKVAMIQEIVSEKSAPKTALDMQKKKEDAAEQKKEPDVPEVPEEPDSQTKAEEAKKKLEEYLQSEERKQNAKERAEKLRKDQFARQLLFGAEAPMVAMEPDRQEEALRAEADYWQQQVNKEKEDAILQQDLKEIEGLSDADKAALDTYLIERDRNYYNLINPMTGNAFAGKYSSNVEALLSRLGQKRVDELAFSLSRKRNAETAEKVDAAAREQVDKGIWSAIGANAASVGAKLLGGYTGILETAKDLTLNHKIDPNNMGQMANIYAGAVQGQTAENIKQTAGKPASYLYQGGMALADIMARSAASGGLRFGNPAVGATLAATQSFSDTLRDATQKGASTGQALTLATVKSGIEAATEKLPLDELFKVAKGGAKPAAEVVKNILKQAGVEIFEEEASLIGTTLAEAAILQEKSSYNQQVMEAIANGATPEQARQQAKWAIIEEAIDTAIVSGISGGASGIGVEIMAARYGDGSAETQSQEGEQQPQTAETEMPEPDADLIDTDNLFEGLRQEQEDQRKAADTEWMQQTFEEAAQNASRREEAQKAAVERKQNAERQKAAYEAVQQETRKQNELEKQITKAEQKLKETGKGSPARIDQLKADLERQKNIVSQKKKFLEYLQGDYETNLEHAVFNQQSLFDQARQDAQKAIADHQNGLITDGQLKAAQDRYNAAGAELSRLKGMTQDQYRMELAFVGLIGDLAHRPTKTQALEWANFSAPENTLPQMNQNTQMEQSAENIPPKSVKWMETAFQKKKDVKTAQIGHTAIPTESTRQVDTNTPVQTSASNVQQQSTEGGQVKGTGAAEADFSGKPAYNATLSADNAQADRTTDVRPMELPRQDINGGNISAVTGNVYGSQNTPDDLASAMEEPVARGDFSYVRISNDEATQRAQKTIESAGGWDRAQLNFHDDVRDGKAGAELSARGALILNHAAEVYEQTKASGNTEATQRAKNEWLSILSDMQKLGTNTAQGMQALRIIRNLMPDDKLEFAKAAVRNMVRDLKIKTEIQIDEKLLTEYENAATDQQRDEIMEKIQQNVANQIPSTMLDKWNALRYTNMLGNLKTTVRNTMGNALNSAAYRAKDIAAASIEAIANKISGGKTGRTKSLIVNKPLQKACGQYFQQVKTAVSSGGKYSENGAASDNFTQGVMDKRNIFKSDSKNKVVRTAGNIAMAPLEGYRMTTNWLMNNKYFGDEAFGKSAFTHAMAGYLQANGVRTAADLQNADAGLLDKAMAYAVREAQEATFHDNSALANVLGKLKKDTGIIGEGMMPFTKTPANVLTRAEEFSLLGIVNTAVKGIQKGLGETRLADKDGRIGDFARKGQDITGNDIINSLSKSLTGSGIFALGAAMMSQGMLSAGADEDDDKAAFDNAMGKQEYAIVMPDGTSYTFDWATPVALPLFMGAQFMELWQEKDFTFADLEKVFTSIADPMIQMSMMQGINDSLDNIKYSDYNLIQFVANAAVGYLTQGLTNTLAGQIEKSTEKNRQTTYIDKDSDTPEWIQRQLGKAFQKVPGIDYQQTDYVNAFGEKEEQRTDALGWINNLFSPGYIKKEKQDDVTKELYRLDETGVEGNVFPDTPSSTLTWTDKTGTVHKDEHLTQEQYQTMAQTQGETAKSILDSLISSKDYAAMTDAQKAEAIQTVYSYARKTAEIAAIGDNHTGYEDSWMMEMEHGKEADYIIRRVTKSGLTGATDALKTAWDRDYDQTGRSDDLKWAYDTFKALTPEAREEVAGQFAGTTAKYIEAREKGISHEDFVSAAETISRWEGTASDGDNRPIDDREAIANAPGLSDSVKDEIMKIYMTDYDPDAQKPEYSELKYDYIRQVLKLSPQQYARTYRAALDSEKNNEDYKAIMKLGYDKEIAQQLAGIYNSTKAGKKAYMDWYNKHH